MIDEKKLIEDLLHNDGIEFQMDFKCDTEEEILHSIQEYTDKLKEGIVNLINAQPKILLGADFAQHEEGWIPVSEKLPKEYVSVLVCIPSEHPLPMVKEAYLANGFWATKTFIFRRNQITHWMPMPDAPKDGGGR